MNLLINFIYSKIISYNFFIFEKIKYNIEKKKIYDLLKIKNPLISILLPTFNRSKILKERAVKSVLSQSYKNYELIIIDDGSTDDTENISQKAHIGKNLSLILQQEKLIRKKNPKRKTERQIKNQSKIKNKFIFRDERQRTSFNNSTK